MQKELGLNSLYIFCPWDLDRGGHDCSVCVVLVTKMDGSAKKNSLNQICVVTIVNDSV